MEKFLVDRAEVLDLIGNTYVDIYHDKEMVTDEEFAVLGFAKEIVDRISALDAQKIEEISTEERASGEWIFNEDGNYECSRCGIAWKEMPLTEENKPVFKACPWCGTIMKKEN